ncbi:MAG: hypothetical protein OXG55_07150 [bacterium]|nr:hypothetical protein [bacterium]MCY3952837.1 hypothetical protein [bacterium]MCY4103018.1 hypothetical protein [bacterium]
MTADAARPLSAEVLRLVFDDLSRRLRAAESYNHHMMIAGGAALALRWDHRLTRDVDVLEHRLRWQHRHGERHTAAVDFISMRFPAALHRAAARTAETFGLAANWLNNAAGLYTPRCDLDAEVLYRSDALVVEAPAARVLLAMKLSARRDKDLDDAARLIAETGISDPAEMIALVVEAFGADDVTAETYQFVDESLAYLRAPTELEPGLDL